MSVVITLVAEVRIVGQPSLYVERDLTFIEAKRATKHVVSNEFARLGGELFNEVVKRGKDKSNASHE